MSTEKPESSFPLGAVMLVAVFAAMIYLAHWRVHLANRSITAIETRMALVESNATETYLAARKAQADLGKLSEAVLRWRMSLPMPTNRVSVITNAAPKP